MYPIADKIDAFEPVFDSVQFSAVQFSLVDRSLRKADRIYSGASVIPLRRASLQTHTLVSRGQKKKCRHDSFVGTKITTLL